MPHSFFILSSNPSFTLNHRHSILSSITVSHSPCPTHHPYPWINYHIRHYSSQINHHHVSPVSTWIFRETFLCLWTWWDVRVWSCVCAIVCKGVCVVRAYSGVRRCEEEYTRVREIRDGRLVGRIVSPRAAPVPCSRRKCSVLLPRHTARVCVIGYVRSSLGSWPAEHTGRIGGKGDTRRRDRKGPAAIDGVAKHETAAAFEGSQRQLGQKSLVGSSARRLRWWWCGELGHLRCVWGHKIQKAARFCYIYTHHSHPSLTHITHAPTHRLLGLWRRGAKHLHQAREYYCTHPRLFYTRGCSVWAVRRVRFGAGSASPGAGWVVGGARRGWRLWLSRIRRLTHSEPERRFAEACAFEEQHWPWLRVKRLVLEQNRSVLFTCMHFIVSLPCQDLL